MQGLQVTDAQLRMTQDQLNVMKVARQALLDQLQDALKDVQPVSAWHAVGAIGDVVTISRLLIYKDFF